MVALGRVPVAVRGVSAVGGRLLWRGDGPRRRLALPAAALLAGIGLALTSNAIIGGQFAFTPGGADFLFGRLVQDGIVGRYLDRVCPDPTLRLCAYRSELPASNDDWMWWSQSPFYKLGGWPEFTPEARPTI